MNVDQGDNTGPRRHGLHERMHYFIFMYMSHLFLCIYVHNGLQTRNGYFHEITSKVKYVMFLMSCNFPGIIIESPSYRPSTRLALHQAASFLIFHILYFFVEILSIQNVTKCTLPILVRQIFMQYQILST